MSRQVITIDGPSGSGKSTVAKILSEKLGWAYLDSGAIYRVVAYYALENNITLIDDIISSIPSIKISFDYHNNIYSVIMNNENVSDKIRSELVGEHASILAQDDNIRSALVSMQRNYKLDKNIITDGRDMGSRIFPNADLKIFLTASINERAARRFLELQNKGAKVDLNVIKSQLEARDNRDINRDSSPLVLSEDSIKVDTSEYSIDEVVEKVHKLWDNLAFLER